MKEPKQEIRDLIAAVDYFLHPMRTDGQALRAESFPPEYRAVERPSAGRFTTTVEPVSGTSGRAGAAGVPHVFLLHGGACILEGMKHGFVMQGLADRGLRVSAFDYPLSPEYQYDEIGEAVYGAWQDLRTWYPDDEMVLFGDSAGATLCLNLLFRLKREGAALPQKLVLPFPFADWSLSAPDYPAALAKEAGMPYECLLLTSRLYAGAADLKDPAVSPYYEEDVCFEGLGDVLLLTCTGDGLEPDCARLAQKLAGKAGTRAETYTEEGYYHDFVLDVELPAAQKMLDEIAAFSLR